MRYLLRPLLVLLLLLPTIVFGQAPTFTSFGSSSTSINSSLVINGTNFSGTTSVLFGGTSASFTVNSSTQITATVPRVANSGPIRITNASGSVVTSTIPVTRQSSSNLVSNVSSRLSSISVGVISTPIFTDLDGDGLLDIIVGEQDGNLNHYEQSFINSTSFTLRTASFNSIDVGTFSSPTFTDLDGDGLLDMLNGKIDGTLSHYEQNAANSTSFTLVTSNYLSIDVGDRSSPTFTDIDGDGLLDMIVGSGCCNLKQYEQNQLPFISSFSANPACQNGTVSITGTDFAGATSVSLNGTSIGTLSGVTATNINFTVPANATSGNVIVTTPSGTSNAVPITITSTPATPTISGNPTFCFGTSTVLTSSAAMGNLWSNGETTQSITVLVPGTYSVQQISGACTTITSAPFETSTIPSGTWLGTTTDWNNAANWCGGVPNASTDVTIPNSGTLPVITGTTATCRNLTIPAGVTFNIGGGANFNLAGNLSGLGNIAGVSGSTLTLNGSTAQTIQRVNVGTLALNNSAGALLVGNVIVKDGVTLTNGILNTQGHNLILLGTATSPVETANSYIYGTVRNNTRMIGTGSGTMFGITIAAGTDDLDTVMVERGENPATYNGNQGIGHVWKIRAGNQPVSGRQITLSWNARADNGKDITRLQVYRRPDTGGEWIRMGNVVDGSSRIITLTTSSFSDWTVSDEDAPLPVTLTSFTGKFTQFGNQLNWSTSSEVNNQGFNIERSTDGKNFTKIGFVKGNGTTNTRQTYQFTDINATEAYYRLQQVDFDGRTEYSATIKVGENNNLAQLQIFPNPASGKVTISTNGTGTIEIVNNLGQVLITQPAIGTNEINISKLAMGVYTVKFNGVSLKLVVR